MEPLEVRWIHDMSALGESHSCHCHKELLWHNIKAGVFKRRGAKDDKILSRNTNKMQLCNRIYYSKVYWRLNMFLAAHRSSSGALNCICSLWFIYCNKIKDFVYIRLSRNTNKMQLCNRIYYSKVYWRLNMFRAAHRSSSGALNCICSLWFIYPCGDRPLSRLSGKWIHFPLSWVGKSRLKFSHSALATAGHQMDI